MTDPNPTLLASLRAAKERMDVLNAADDRIAQAIVAVEEAIRRHINTRVRIAVDERRFLAFGKYNGAWRLLIEDQGGQRSLASSSREERAQVFAEGLVEKLISDARSQMDKQIEQREQALSIASELIDALTKGL